MKAINLIIGILCLSVFIKDPSENWLGIIIGTLCVIVSQLKSP